MLPDLAIATLHVPRRRLVEERLRAAIMQNRFLPGQRLVERDLCEALGVSRTLVREALRQLEAEGLVQLVPYKGPVVAALSARDAREIYAVREVMEALAAREFAVSASDEQRERLRALAEQFAHCVARERLENVLQIKEQFYAVLLEGSGNATLRELFRQINNRLMILRATSLSSRTRAPRSVAEIRRIVAAILKKDPEAAWKATVAHVREAAKAAIGVLEAQGAEAPPAPRRGSRRPAA